MAVIAEKVEARGNNNDSIGGRDGVYTAIAGNDGRVRLYGPGMHGKVVDGARDAHACSLAHNPATGRIVVRVIEYRGGHILAEYDTGIAPPASASAGPSPTPAARLTLGGSAPNGGFWLLLDGVNTRGVVRDLAHAHLVGRVLTVSPGMDGASYRYNGAPGSWTRL